MADVVVWPNPASNYKDFAAAEARSSTPWQLNAFWSLESSEYYEQVKDARQLLRKGSEKAFDLEMTYLTTSDIPMPYAYSFINFFKPKIDYEQKRQDKIAAAFISNCSPMNNRKEVLAELIELLPGKIDSFGSCIQNANTTEVLEKLNLLEEGKKLSMWEEKTKIIERYKFTIAFENSNDEDYVTEKYYQALEAGSPPIHLGLTSDQLEKFKPSPNAAINVADFPDVKSLAKRLEEISKNREEYESMLDWKNMPLSGDFGKIVRWGKESEWCRLAKLLRKTWSNPNAFNKQRYENFYLRRKLKPIQSFNLSAPMFHTKPHF
ncbi:hypothetical protein BY996DRAFT_7218774 [Phakopsora pachyrhizi]|nr:hypothetical protein BY996DRAFT_7218774 [Phakopsora pachyrhizi]